LGGPARATPQATPDGCLPLPRRPAIRRCRKGRRRNPRSGPPSRLGWHRLPSQDIQARRLNMNTSTNSSTERLFAALPTLDESARERLHARLANAANDAGLLDVAYRTMD